ncbi:MAG: RNA-binding S4 domain-containing protein [Erysipelotrichaceae bacterium]|nr:RNA-binding S4 domain-containing protein [Erysipelotrichaceae bacterium]
MRIDKYLKVARILKRRTVAKELALNDRLFVNDRLAKASSEVKPGDIITIEFGHRTFRVRVLEVRENASKQDALGMYEVIEELKNDEV